MRSTKISPVGTSVRSTTIHGEFSWTDPRVADEDQIDEKERVNARCEEYDPRRELGYWHARSMFLRSYHFSEDKEGWKKKLTKNVKKVNQKMRLALLDMRREVLVKRNIGFGIKVYVVKVDFPMASAFVRCYFPTIHEKA